MQHFARGAVAWVAGMALIVAAALAASQQHGIKVVSAVDYEEVLRNLDDEAVFQRFLNKLPTITIGQDVKRTYYIIEGDMKLPRESVRPWLSSHLPATQTVARAAMPKGKSTDELYVNTTNGVPDKWVAGERALTYAIDRNAFTPDQYAEVGKNMPLAAADWVKECQCGLSITHRPEFDNDPKLDQVTFIVTFTPNQPQYLAVAFFPGDPKDQRYLQIMAPYFTTTDYDHVGILRHEIGHILGYRHTHIGGVPGCELWQEPGYPNWIALSSYDSESAMHYPCGGGGSKDFMLSKRDKEDHHKHYSQ